MEYHDSFSTTLGLRYTVEEKDRTALSSPRQGKESSWIFRPVAGPDVFWMKAAAMMIISPTLIARYFVNPEIMTYASISRGFKSGGLTSVVKLQGKNGEFEPEEATNYELGWKGSTEDRRLQLNGTFYW